METELKLGDRVVCVPETLGGSYMGEDRKMHYDSARTGEIVYIHPKGRYVTVEIEMLSGAVRESFKPWDVQKIRKKRRR